MITTDEYGRVVGEKTYAGAAARKMILVTRALRSVGRRAIVVSLPFVGINAKRLFYDPVLTSDSGVPIIFLSTFRSKYLRKLLGPIILAAFATCRIDPGDTVIVYNHAIEYVAALVVLRLRGVKVVQDIEDAPRIDERGMRGFLNRLSFAITSKLSARRKMVVADHVAKYLKLDDYIIIRGVASQEIEARPCLAEQKWAALCSGNDLRLHYGGTLIPDTGVDLFCESVEVLAQNEDRLDHRVSFNVTGVGDLGKIRALQSRVQHSKKINVELLPALNKAEYLALVDSCHGSLSLKRPGTSISDTTFPSKVIEITASGLALVSTRLGDVTSLFNDKSAFFLQAYESSALADVIVEMARDPERVERVAKAGNDVCTRAFSAKMVGEDMIRLL